MGLTKTRFRRGRRPGRSDFVCFRVWCVVCSVSLSSCVWLASQPRRKRVLAPLVKARFRPFRVWRRLLKLVLGNFEFQRRLLKRVFEEAGGKRKGKTNSAELLFLLVEGLLATNKNGSNRNNNKQQQQDRRQHQQIRADITAQQIGNTHCSLHQHYLPFICVVVCKYNCLLLLLLVSIAL